MIRVTTFLTYKLKILTLCTFCQGKCWVPGTDLYGADSLILGTRFSILGTRIRFLKHLQKTLLSDLQILPLF